MASKAEELAKESAGHDGRTDREKLGDIGLSPEEVAALEGKDTDEEADKGEPGKDAGKPTREADDATKRKDAAAADGKKDADADEAEDAEDLEAADTGPGKTVPDHFIPLAETLTEEDLQEIDTALKDLKTQFDDGDIDYEQYTDERLKYEKILWHHEQAEISNVNAVEQRWQWERDWYLQSNQELNQNQVIYGAFAAQVNALLADDEWGIAPGFDILTEAHRRVASEIASLEGPQAGNVSNGRPKVGDKQSAQQKADDALAKAKAAEAGKRPPHTLAKVPAAEQNVDTSKWAHIDSLDGDAYQKAIDRLSPAELAEYEESH